MRSMTIPIHESYKEAIDCGSLVIVESKDGYSTELRARESFYFAPTQSMFSAGEKVPFTVSETGTGRIHREAHERLDFLSLLAELTKCPACGIYDCTQHGNPTAKELLGTIT